MKGPRPETLLSILHARAAETPDRVYVIDIEDRHLTYREMVDLAGRWNAAYRKIGVERDDVIVTMQFNTIESLAGWLGLASLGAVEAAINTDYRGDLLAHVLNTTMADTMLLARQYLDRVVEIAADLLYLKQIVVIDSKGTIEGLPFNIVSGEDFLSVGASASLPADPATSDIAAVLFTSGTTGPSKGVLIPWGQLCATARFTLPFDDLGAHDVFFNAGPTYHIGAKVFPYLAALVGGRHVMRPYVSESRMPAEYRKYGVTTCFYPPFAWLDEPPHPDDPNCALHNLLLPLPLPQMVEFKRRFGCRTYSVYSMTELSCPIADPDWNVGRIDAEGHFSCGMLRNGYPGYEARIVDEEDRPVAPGAVGELILRAIEPWGVNAGYLNNPEATAAAWRNGWFHTGDAFSRDEDGHFYFRDRLKDCIRRKAENISSFEIESIVRQHSGIADCAAVASKRSNETSADEDVRLFVVCRGDAQLDARKLILWLVPRMPRFMVPRFIEFVDMLPKTPNLKVRKSLLRDQPLTAETWDLENSGIELPR